MSEVVVEIEQGKLKGTTGEDYHGGKFYKFLGIPFAKAPVGHLRFKAPQPPEPWKGILNATKVGQECPSADMFFAHFVGVEDNCLNLNVYTKELPKKNDESLKKPVMVWIHGGAFTMGSNRPHMYGPDYMMTQDIVLVTINYRLGILGFASFNDQSLEVPGNAGLKDQRMALRWVQTNIGKFGGDRGNVTIFGESAGSASVHYLTLSPSTEGLFHKAIAQSGCALNNWAWGKQGNSAEIQKYMGYKETDEKKILEKLYKESARSIVRGQSRFHEHFAAGQVRPWCPVVEPPGPDAIITEHPSKVMFSRGNQRIPMIIGYNSGEGIFFELVRRTAGVGLPRDLQPDIPYELGLEVGSEECAKAAAKLKKTYFDGQDWTEEDIDKIYQLKGDAIFMHQIQNVMKLQAKHSDQPIYAYRMSLISSLNVFRLFAMTKYFKTVMVSILLARVFGKQVQGMLGKLPQREADGVVHADDLLYLFPTFFAPSVKKGSAEDFHIQRFVKMWTNFARTGNPTPEVDEKLNKVKWNPLKNNGQIEFLDLNEDLKMIGNVDKERLDVWDEIFEDYYKALL